MRADGLSPAHLIHRPPRPDVVTRKAIRPDSKRLLRLWQGDGKIADQAVVATCKIGASSTLLIAMMTFESLMPAICWDGARNANLDVEIGDDDRASLADLC